MLATIFIVCVILWVLSLIGISIIIVMICDSHDEISVMVAVFLALCDLFGGFWILPWLAERFHCFG